MSISFLFLIAAAVILRYLGSQAKNSFTGRLAGLLPRNVVAGHLRILFQEYPDRLRVFRRRVLPYSALALLLDGLACAVFAAGLWYFAPDRLDGWSRPFLQYGSLALIAVALLVDLVQFFRLFIASVSRAAGEPEPDAE